MIMVTLASKYILFLRIEVIKNPRATDESKVLNVFMQTFDEKIQNF